MLAKVLAQDIKLIVLDIDGVMTDGGLYYDDEGRLSKRFHAHDGVGVKIAQAAGLRVAVVSGMISKAVESRMRILGIEDYYQGFQHKVESVNAIREKYGLEWSEIAYVGDDWIDFGPMRLVGLPIAVQNAQSEVKELARLTTSASGGNGAVREAVMFILEAQGKYESLFHTWMNRG